MNIIFGFGSTEEGYREKVKRDLEIIVSDCVSNKFKTLDDVWFDEELLKEIETQVKEYAEKTRKEEREIQKKEIKDRPERYSYVYINFAGIGSDLFFGIDFNHINSKHPMSNDGVAMMSIRDSKWINIWDFRDGVLEVSLLAPSPSK